MTEKAQERAVQQGEPSEVREDVAKETAPVRAENEEEEQEEVRIEKLPTPTEKLTDKEEKQGTSQRPQKLQEIPGRPRRQRRAPDYYGMGPRAQDVGSEPTNARGE